MGKTDTHGPLVAVFGATGYTGRFVLKELLRRGIRPVAIARNPVALSAADFAESEVERRRATVDNAGSLDEALRGTAAVINCAGPFVDTAEPVVGAALRTRDTEVLRLRGADRVRRCRARSGVLNRFFAGACVRRLWHFASGVVRYRGTNPGELHSLQKKHRDPILAGLQLRLCEHTGRHVGCEL